MSSLFERFVEHYREFTPELLNNLPSLYSENVVFEDPVHRTEGLDALRAYFAGMMGDLVSCHFVIRDASINASNGAVEWDMKFQHRKLNGGEIIALNGVSIIRFDEKIYYQRDYFDMGAMLYEHIPVLGSGVRYLKKRLAS